MNGNPKTVLTLFTVSLLAFEHAAAATIAPRPLYRHTAQ